MNRCMSSDSKKYQAEKQNARENMGGYFGQDGQGGPLWGDKVPRAEWWGHTPFPDVVGKPQSSMLFRLTSNISELLALIPCQN